MKGIGSERMSGVDTAWLRMETPENLMMITAILLLDEEVDRERLRDVVAERILSYRRFRQRIEHARSTFRLPKWVPDERFSLEHHLRFQDIGRHVSREELERVIGCLMSTPLDLTRAPWQFHLIEGYERGPVLLCRLHHCIADGMALLRVLLSLTDGEPEPTDRSADTDDAFYERGHPGEVRNRRLSLKKRVTKKVGEGLIIGMKSFESLARLLLRSPDPRTSLTQPLQEKKCAAWSEPILLEDVKKIGKYMGATVNDVLLAAVTGAIRRFIEEEDGPARRDLDVRAAVPVNLRSPDARITMGNQFGLVFLSLPVGRARAKERLRVLKERMNVMKRSAEAVVVYGLLSLVGRAPPAIEAKIVDFLARKVTAVATNVPGPRKQRYLAGAPVRAVLPWAPQAGRVGLGISVFSYAGEVRLGVATDRGVTEEPRRIARLFTHEFEMLMRDSVGDKKTFVDEQS